MVADHNKVYKNEGRALLALPSLSAVLSETEGLIIPYAMNSRIMFQPQINTFGSPLDDRYHLES